MITLTTTGLNRKPLDHCHRAPEDGQCRQVSQVYAADGRQQLVTDYEWAGA